uniref:Uncharacterized protein n=1 Tax=Vespula pensylvanica TaxID=30213 RepID=A0A834U7J9_VESPE|nr:hypothetical protein H0235_010501 [Vespula pensylvanica]
MTLQRSPLKIEAILVGNPSMTIDIAEITLGNEDFPDDISRALTRAIARLTCFVFVLSITLLRARDGTSYGVRDRESLRSISLESGSMSGELTEKCEGESGVDASDARCEREVEAICYGQQFRIYWRLSEEEYIPVYNSIGLKAALNTIYEPRIYVVVDEIYFWSQISKSLLLEVLERYNFASIPNLHETTPINIFSDLKVLKCALTEKRPTDDPAARFDHLLSKTSAMYTNETRKVDGQLKLLMKGNLVEASTSSSMRHAGSTRSRFPKEKDDTGDGAISEIEDRKVASVKGSKKKLIAN